MAGAKATLTSPQRVLIVMEESMKKEATETFAAQGLNFSEGVRQCIAAKLAPGGSVAVDAETKRDTYALVPLEQEEEEAAQDQSANISIY